MIDLTHATARFVETAATKHTWQGAFQVHAIADDVVEISRFEEHAFGILDAMRRDPGHFCEQETFALGVVVEWDGERDAMAITAHDEVFTYSNDGERLGWCDAVDCMDDAEAAKMIRNLRSALRTVRAHHAAKTVSPN